MPKYSHVFATIKGTDCAIVNRVSRALRRGGVSDSIVEAFQTEATAGDHQHLLQIVARWVTVKE